jgi:hypothetical protein
MPCVEMTVGEAAHFNLSSTMKEVRRRTMTCARGRSCGSVAKNGPVSGPLGARAKLTSQVGDSRQSNTETERLMARSAVAMLPIRPFR